MSKFGKIFEQVKIGNMISKNRIVMPGMSTNLGTNDGFGTDLTNAYYEERAKGGCGLIIVEPACVLYPQGNIAPRALSINDDKFIPGLSNVAESIKRHGARAAIQLNHGGRDSSRLWGGESVGPSTIAAPAPEYGYAEPEIPRELNISEIARIVECFAQGAERAKRAGFDGIEIHAAHGYLISNFLSSASNKRNDLYGGEVGNRARLLLEVIDAVKKAVGDEYPVWCRIDGVEYEVDGGITLEESLEVVRLVEDGGVDAIHVSAHGFGINYLRAPLVHCPGYLIPLAAAIKKAVSIPVITVGRISPVLAEETLRKGKADLVAMGRQLIADPELPNKLRTGGFADIRPCIYCYVCMEQLALEKIGCAVNPNAGNEIKHTGKRVEKSKKVLVVGAGPGGIETATVASERGHRVILCDKGPKLGGTLVLVGILKKDIEGLVKYMVNRMKKSQVEVIPSREINIQHIEAINPDVVVLSVGTKLPIYQIPGGHDHNVVNGNDIRQVIVGQLSPASLRNLAGKRILWYLALLPFMKLLSPSLIRLLTRLWMPFGKKIIVVGGDRAGCEIAEFLAERGKQVTIVENGKRLAKQASFFSRNLLLAKLMERRVRIFTEVKANEITEAGLVITTNEGMHRSIEADTIILAPAPEPNVELAAILEGKVTSVYLVGDCAKPGGIREAIADGFRVANTI
ncbi:FAD-dependent oxidoreductase [Chloroflexota bacterium]